MLREPRFVSWELFIRKSPDIDREPEASRAALGYAYRKFREVAMNLKRNTMDRYKKSLKLYKTK